jgi:DNA invertase Pin-like site-specific DNA recombinase
VDFSSPVGQATLTIISAISQLERNLISERIKNALAAKKMAAARDGSDWKCGRKGIITEELLAAVGNLRAQGTSIQQSANQLGVSKSTIQRALMKSKTSKKRSQGT